MKKYHKECTQSQSKQETSKSKPLCDCTRCRCKNCPDLVKKLSIKTENPPDICADVILKTDETCSPKNSGASQLDLDVINKDDCFCNVVARAVAANVHTNNIGMIAQREAKAEQKKNKPENTNK